MSLFQKTVFKKHLKDLNTDVLNEKWNKFQSKFHDVDTQQNILNSKEEQYQEGFLRDLFCDVLGYRLNPNPNYNLKTEQKNVSNSKKADGAIIIDDNVIGVIELKGSNITDLSKIEDQAFGYKNNQKNCIYVITSNFQKLRFYINNAVEFIEFNLFTLDKDSFDELYLCLSYENIKNNIPLKIKNESVSKEDIVTKQLYKDYSIFKRELFENLIKLNPQYNQLELFKKSQKLLDRFLFIFFGEDRGLLPPNSVRLILDQWKQLNDLDEYTPLYARFKKYFGYMNTGFKGKNYDVFAYNGGLFKPDEILDNIFIDDEVLFRNASCLSEYDFNSEVDVNILGHIFENSLNQIEEIRAIIDGKVIEKQKTKRKTDGVFYTPKHITKYIIENTLGVMCNKQKEILEIEDEKYISDKRRQNKTKLTLLNKLNAYREYLLELKVLDPACGSGAFLNEALDFLIREHNYIDELEAKLTGSSLVLSNIENSILENNLYGVDINEESVEIAKLSLWLRTAKPHRKLNSLNNNIKCGNSLIQDKSIAPENAFVWENEFPHVFAKGGFDVVIGNPPYVFGGNEGISDIDKAFFKNTYKTGSGKVNLFTLFIERSYQLLKENGEFSFIIPNTFLRVTSYESSRKFFLENYKFRELIDLGSDVFAGAVTSAIILIASKDSHLNDFEFEVKKGIDGSPVKININSTINNGYIISSSTEKSSKATIEKIKQDCIPLGDLAEEMIFGVVISKNANELIFDTNTGNLKPYLEGKDIGSYTIKNSGKFIDYQPEKIHRARTPKIFEAPEKLLVQRITGGRRPLKVAYDDQQFYTKESINNIILKKDISYHPKFILALMNSKLINWFYNNAFTNDSSLTVNISKEYLSQIPVKHVENDQQNHIVEHANNIISQNISLKNLANKFLRVIERKFGINVNSKRLMEWYLLDYKDFLKELTKLKIKLPLSQEIEWEDVFELEKAKALDLHTSIISSENSIDQMIYELYKLSDDEISMINLMIDKS
ncbi:Eco57I restriction-modification methylase domain-containing protein [Acinetobacter baumannii]|uniref:Eco57I restriction-modification methylase domain-containing protein n=1 Tax=Acinetobacter baumannii TaxID=470 RepID=UPI0015D0E9E8|nr:TaqI-like C-terminal specificity domain-containing protein [Acinetobacter baumannii]MBI1410829.1 N-6 DNA methylase [Acinetobacter baumannii]MBI1430280.1 N-6 DNA methylase [Acinetobacter baumannii]QLI39069.1 N-6 DNA methylase [Acinetobacter baumannii]